MLTPILQEDDRRRGASGLVLSVAQKADGSLRLSVDRVTASRNSLPNAWDFNVFSGHFEIDDACIQLIETEVGRPEDEQGDNGVGVPDHILKGIGHALLTSLIVASIEARNAGPI